MIKRGRTGKTSLRRGPSPRPAPLLVVLIAMLGLAAPAWGATSYVSLGDSFAAGPLIPLQAPAL